MDTKSHTKIINKNVKLTLRDSEDFLDMENVDITLTEIDNKNIEINFTETKLNEK